MVTLIKEGTTYRSSPVTNAEIISRHVKTAEEILKKVRKVTDSAQRHSVDYYKVCGDLKMSLVIKS